MPSCPLPIQIEEIDRDWLTEAMRTTVPGATVRDVQIAEVKHGTCTKLRLRLDMDETGRRGGIPATVILKGGFEPHSREWHFMHEQEVRGYDDVYRLSALPSPKVYFAGYERERLQGIVIMEDLVERGVTFCDPLKPQTYDQVARRLSILARHHAKTWCSPHFSAQGRWSWARDIAEVSKPYFAQYLVPEVWQKFVDSPRGAAASVRYHDRKWIDDMLDRHIVLSRQLPFCMNHGDTHLGNLYIEPDGTPGFLDTVPGRAPAMMEISYHLTCALDLGDRRRWEKDLLQHYRQALQENGVEPPPIEETMRQYAIFLAHGYLVFLVNESLFQRESINTAYTARFSAAMLDHDTIGLLDQVR